MGVDFYIVVFYSSSYLFLFPSSEFPYRLSMWLKRQTGEYCFTEIVPILLKANKTSKLKLLLFNQSHLYHTLGFLVLFGFCCLETESPYCSPDRPGTQITGQPELELGRVLQPLPPDLGFWALPLCLVLHM